MAYGNKNIPTTLPDGYIAPSDSPKNIFEGVGKQANDILNQSNENHTVENYINFLDLSDLTKRQMLHGLRNLQVQLSIPAIQALIDYNLLPLLTHPSNLWVLNKFCKNDTNYNQRNMIEEIGTMFISNGMIEYRYLNQILHQIDQKQLHQMYQERQNYKGARISDDTKIFFDQIVKRLPNVKFWH